MVWATLLLQCLLGTLSLTLAEIRIGYRGWRENCTVNRDCKRHMKCIPVTMDNGTCGTLTSDGKHRCLCVSPSRIGHRCNDLQDCVNSRCNGLDDCSRCVNGFCKVRGGEGVSCGPYLDDRDCKDGFTCLNGTCTTKVKEKGRCDVFWNCEKDLACIKNSCLPKSSPGGPCDSSIDCKNSICVLNNDGSRTCSSDIQAILGSVVAFTVVVATTGTLQFCAWRPRRRG